MTRAEIEKSLLEGIEKVKAGEVKKGSIRMEANLREDIGLDSLDLMEMVFEIEERFQVTLKEQDAKDLKTVADVITLIENRMPKK